MNIEIRNTKVEDATAIKKLHQAITDFPDGIIRRPDEITTAYILQLIQAATESGLALVATQEDKVIGEIHAHTPKIFAFQHLLTDLTIMVDPGYHNLGVGSKLFKTFLDKVQSQYPHILRVELFVREHNAKNVGFYQNLGFVNEGRQVDKIYLLCICHGNILGYTLYRSYAI